MTNKYWSKEEHDKFEIGIATFGKSEHAKISEWIGTRTQSQVPPTSPDRSSK
jgi:hypothetical protein